MTKKEKTNATWKLKEAYFEQKDIVDASVFRPNKKKATAHNHNKWTFSNFQANI